MYIRKLFFLACLFSFFKSYSQDFSLLDTIQAKWDILLLPAQGPAAAEYYQYGDSLYYFITYQYDAGPPFSTIRKSGDFGKTWTQEEYVDRFLNNKISIFKLESINEKDSPWGGEYYLYYNKVNLKRSLDLGKSYKSVYTDKIPFLCSSTRGCVLNDFKVILGDSTLIITRGTVDLLGGTTRYISFDLGDTWTIYKGSPTFKIINNIVFSFDNGQIKYTQKKDGVYREDSISTSKLSFQSAFINSPIAIKDSVFTIIDNQSQNSCKRYTTSDKGNSWKVDSFPFSIRELKQVADTLFVLSNIGIFKTSDIYLNDFKKIFPFDNPPSNDYSGFSILKSGYYINNFKGELFRSTDSGTSWKMVNNTEGVMEMNALYLLGDSITVKSWAGYHFGGTDFKKLDFKAPMNVDYGEDFLFKQGNVYFKSNASMTVFRSTDWGNTWKNFTTFFDDKAKFRLRHDSTRIYYYLSRFMYISYDGGETVISKPINRSIKDVLFVGNTAYCLAFLADKQKYGILKSEDEGTTWNEIAVFNNFSHQVARLFYSKNRLYITTNDKVYYESKDSAKTWTQRKTDFNYENIIAHGKHTIFHSESANHLKITADDGISWTYLNMSYEYAYQFNKNYIYAYRNPSLYTWGTPSPTTYVRRIHLDSLVSRVSALENYGILRGSIFKDENNNCLKDASENTGIADKVIRISPRNYTAVTDSEGQFEIALPPDNYVISTDSILYFNRVCGGDSLKIVLKDKQTVDTNIVFKKRSDIYDLALSLSSGSRARPGFEMDFRVKIENIGTENIDSATVKIELPKPYLSLVASNPTAILNENNIVWQVKNLAVGELRYLNCTLKLAPDTPLSTNLVFKADGQILNKKDTLLANNADSLQFVVTGAFDPNDKTALGTPTIDDVDYLIRFQNTGTDTAFTVVVVDTLASYFEPMSIHLITASHPYKLTIDKRILTFTFNKILLPDSIVNEKASHGFVRFKIKPQSWVTWAINTTNKAAIYFDYNEPIITNVAQSLLSRPKVFRNETLTLCEGETYRGKIYTSNATATRTTSSQRVDTVHITEIIVNPLIKIYKDTFLQQSDKFFNKTWNDNDRVEVRKNALSGCDTILYYTLHLLKTKTIELPSELNDVTIYPNPTKDYISISYALNKSTWVKIIVYNVIGQKVQILDPRTHHTEGVHHISKDIKNLPQGTYQLNIETENGVVSRRFVKF